MNTPQFPRAGTVLWCSAVLCTAIAGLFGVASLDVRSVDLRHHPLAAGQVAARFNEPAPDWLQLPRRSTLPVMRRIGSSGGWQVVSYRTLIDAEPVMQFHQERLAWKGLDWIDLVVRDASGDNGKRIAVGSNALTGEHLQITVRDLGYAREVELKLDGPARNLTASVVPQ
jgi:hypothetical protein